jgi:magnesium transporter
MISYLRSTNYRPGIKEISKLQPGTWVRSERPNEEEMAQLVGWGLDQDILTDALDPHEVPRVELEGDWTYFITRLPDTDDDFNDFTTPILFVLGAEHIVTVSRDPLGRLWQPFIDKTDTPTTQKTKLFMLMVEAIAEQYQRRVASINRQMRASTNDVRRLRPQDIATFVEYERKLNDYLDALSIDLEQLMARCKSLLRTITNVRDSYRAVMDTRLNETLRILTVITLAMTIPTMIAGVYGMNVPLPAQNSPIMFWVIVGISATAALSLSYYFMKKR